MLATLKNQRKFTLKMLYHKDMKLGEREEYQEQVKKVKEKKEKTNLTEKIVTVMMLPKQNFGIKQTENMNLIYANPMHVLFYYLTCYRKYLKYLFSVISNLICVYIFLPRHAIYLCFIYIKLCIHCITFHVIILVIMKMYIL